MIRSSLYLLISLSLLLVVCSCEEDDPEIKDPGSVGIWKYYSNSNGLKDNFVWTIFEDSDGVIWIGTVYAGLHRFDGNNWKYYDTGDGLLHNTIYGIGEDSEGNMWIATEDGLSILIRQLDYFSNYDEIFEGVPYWPTCIYYDRDTKYMWVGTFGTGVILYSEDAGPEYFFSTEHIDRNYINCISEDKKGRIWIGTDDGAMYYENGSMKYFGVEDGLYYPEVTDILEDSWGDIWFSTFHGPYMTRYDGNDTEPFKLSEESTIWSMVEDHNQNIWMTSVYGIVKYNGVTLEVFRDKEGLTDNAVVCSMVDRKGQIWFGTIDGGINIYIPE